MATQDPDVIAVNYVDGPVVLNDRRSSSLVVRRGGRNSFHVTYVPSSGGAASGSTMHTSLAKALGAAGITEYEDGVSVYHNGKKPEGV